VLVRSRSVSGRITDKQFGRIYPLLAALAVLLKPACRKTASTDTACGEQ
jgi:hypothetical protein